MARSTTTILGTALVCLACMIPGPGLAGAETDTVTACLECHGSTGSGSELRISTHDWQASVHASEFDCQACHAGVTDETHQRTPGSGAVDCAICHDQENRHGHNARGGGRPDCATCHTRHNIRPSMDPLASTHANGLRETCRGCHPFEFGRVDYLSRLPALQIKAHKKQRFGLRFDRENCVGCHQGMASHGLAAVPDDQGCHRCHGPVDGASRLWGAFHRRADLDSQPRVFLAGVFYQVLVALLLAAGCGALVRKMASPKKGA